MVHPSELLRTASFEGREFSAPTNILDSNPIDCGLSNLPCLNKIIDLEKFAKLKVFVVFLSLVGFVHGLTLSYFRGTSQIWAKHYNIDKENIDWLIYTNEFFVGLLALAVSYWGNRIHRVSWIGGLTIFHSINCLVLIVPEVYRKNSRNETIPDDNLCLLKPILLDEEEINYIAISILAVFQVLYAAASVSFLSHGITYLDDNSARKHSPACIGIVLAAKELGKQVGLYMTGFPLYFGKEVVFVSPVWITAAVVTFLAGIFVAMFPKNLPLIVMQQVSASIVDIASGHRVITKKKEVFDGFLTTLWRLVKNKVLMFNILCVVFMQSAIINFEIFEKHFNQSRFFVSYKNDSSLIQLAADLLKQPLVAISMIATGTIVAKSKPQARSLLKYNILVSVLVILFFASSAFLKCDQKLTNEYSGTLSTSYCSAHCSNCSTTEFQPICINNKTYFSPCVAGCSSVKEINSNMMYQNCTCGGSVYEKGNYQGSEGTCNSNKCDLFWTLSQANSVITSALLGTIFVTNLVINMRCVLTKDKASALGLESTFLGIVPYIPVKFSYEAIAGNFCQFRSKGDCSFYSDKFGLFLSISTVVLMSISAILAIVVLFLIHFKYEAAELEESGEEMVEISPESHEIGENRGLMSDEIDGRGRSEEELDLSLANGGRFNSANSLSRDSLIDLENVGDDHDSVGSLETLNRRRL